MALQKNEHATVKTEEIKNFFDVLKPAPCPYELVRIGGDRDGAYLLPNDFKDIKACFSPGVCNRKSFEDELVDKYDICTYMCDFSSDVEKFSTPLKKGQQFFEKKWLDINGNSDSISLEQWVTKECPDTKDDLLLQMDIEGAEYRNILATPTHILQRFRIIVLEVHSLNKIGKVRFFKNTLYPFFKTLSEHFICVHAHPNNVAPEIQIAELGFNLPALMELTFLRKDRLKASKGNLVYPILPHPMDIKRNVAVKPPVFLNEKWLDGPRNPVATQKMCDDALDYIQFMKNQQPPTFAVEKHAVHMACQDLYKMLLEKTFGKTKEPTAENISEGKPFVVNDKYGKFPGTGIVKDQSPFFFHTDFGFNRSITIDLCSIHIVSEVILKNRTDVCRERAVGLFYKLHKIPSCANAVPFPLFVDQNFLTETNVESRTPVPDSQARYVTILSLENTALHLSSIQIIGYRK